MTPINTSDKGNRFEVKTRDLYQRWGWDVEMSRLSKSPYDRVATKDAERRWLQIKSGAYRFRWPSTAERRVMINYLIDLSPGMEGLSYGWFPECVSWVNFRHPRIRRYFLDDDRWFELKFDMKTGAIIDMSIVKGW